MQEQDWDGRLVTYPAAPPIGKSKKILHINGVASDLEKQQRDLEALVWLTLDQPLDVVGIHNSTQGLQNDMLESLLGKAELYRFWPEHQTAASRKRLQGYAQLLQHLQDSPLGAEDDILEVLQGKGISGTPAWRSGLAMLEPRLIEQFSKLPFIGNWDDLETYLYGAYPVGGPRPILRLAYEIITSIRAGVEVFVVAHSQGLVIAALALQIVQAYFGTYQHWSTQLHLVGYGPAIMIEDLPIAVRSQAILLQHRQDLVAESFSNLRNINLWNNVQTQTKNLMERAESLMQIIGQDTHHSASFYLGLTGDTAGDRAAKLLQQILIQDWSNPLLQSLKGCRLILEDLPSP
jgi:hypothetical protein